MVVYSKKLITNVLLDIVSHDVKSLGTVIIKEDLKGLTTKLHYTLHYYENNQGREVSLLSEHANCQNRSENLWGFHIHDVVFFLWENKTNSIHYKLEAKGNLELLTYWLLHVTLPIFFTVEKQYTFLHAGAVEVEGKPIIFLAESFGGKSTMTDYFIKQGHTMISDDKVGTYEENGLFFSVPSHPYHRPYRKAEDIGIFVDNFATEPKVMHTFYCLERTQKNANVEIKEINGIEKFRLLRLSSQFNLSFQKKSRFEYLTRMSNNIQLYQVKVPWDLDRLNEVYSTIIAHLQNIETQN